MSNNIFGIRFLSIYLIWSLIGVPLTPALAQEQGEPAESFTFPETAGSVAEPLVESGKKNAVKTRSAPVTSSGMFTHEIPIDLPPGRLEMTPTLSLAYSSGAAKNDSPVGAGWVFGPSVISRSTLNGFPPLKRVDGSLRYDDDNTVFESHSGRLVPATDGPTGATGVLYIPLREYHPIRYEYRANIANGGMWIEHDPSGIKGYYGADLAGNQAQVVNELGTYSWLLLMEVDENGNHISYEYHNIEDQNRANLKDLQRAPVLKSISWGGNRITGLPHVFKVTVEVSEQQGGLDLLHGNLLMTSKVARIRVEGPNGTHYWTYSLTLEESRDTGRLLLKRVKREAPGEAPRQTTFTYSENDPSTPRFGEAAPLSQDFPFVELGGQAPEEAWCAPPFSPLDRVYATVSPSVGDFSPYPTVEMALSPPELRSGHKFFDFDGDGDTDILYHPAGLSTTASRILYDRSFIQVPGQPWTSMQNLGSEAEEEFYVFGIPSSVYFSQLGDVDGDFDIDGVTFPIAYTTEGTAGGIDGGGGGLVTTDLCCSPGFWNMCGNIDPVPDFLDSLSTPLGTDEIIPGPLVDPTIMGLDLGGGLGAAELGDKIIGIIPGAGRAPGIAVGGSNRPPVLFFSPIGGGLGSDLGPSPPDGGEIPPGGIDIPWTVNCLPYVEQCLSSGTQCGGPCDLPESQRPAFCDLIGSGGVGSIPGSGEPVCEGLFPSDLTEMPLTVLTNQARNTTLPMQYQQNLEAWPAGVGHRVRVKRKLTFWGDRFSSEVLSDFLAPIADVNADGRGDIILLKSIKTPPQLTAQPPIYKFLPRTYLVKNDRYELDLEFKLFDGYCGDLLGPDNSASTSEFTESLVDLLNEGIFMECKGYDNDECVLNRLYPHLLNFNSFLMDINSDGLPDLVVARPPKAKDGIQPGQNGPISVDDIQLGVANYFRLSVSQLKSDTNAKFIAHPRNLAMYLSKQLGKATPKEIARKFGVKDEKKVLHAISKVNTLLKADKDFALKYKSIVDAVKKPSKATQVTSKICVDGHEVYLNRGYGWEETMLENETWSSPEVYNYSDLANSPLLRLRNRDKLCFNLANMEDSNSISPEQRTYEDIRPLPMGAMATVDINADGRLDIVFAYQQKCFIKTLQGYIPEGGTPTQSYRDYQEVYLNTGRGFKKDNTDYNFPDPFYLAVEPMSGWVSGKPWLSDLARFVDVNSDGLVDVVTAGYIRGPIFGAQGPIFRCNTTKWYQNQGVVPDLLTRVEDESGAWITVEYIAATWPQAQAEGIVSGNGQLPPGLIVVNQIQSAAGPEPSAIAAGAHQFAVESILMRYMNYVRDDFSSESIGFEKVIADFKNSLPDGTPRETVTVTRTYDVRPTIDSISVRHPLKGVEIEVETKSGSDLLLDRSIYAISSIGQAARIRKQGGHNAECFSTACKWSGYETTAFDDFGNPEEIREGNSNGITVTMDNEVVTTQMSYDNRIGPLWKIGLLSDSKIYGYKEDINGTPESQALLSHSAWEYDTRGRLWKEKRLGVTPADYASRLNIPTEDVITYEYYNTGLLEAVKNNHYASGLGTVILIYNSHQLHVASRRVEYTHYIDGQPQGINDLTESYETDLRTGETKKFTDYNGETFTTEFDSHGRPLIQKGPGGLLLTEYSYSDAYPVKVTLTIQTDPGKSYQRVTYFDGEGAEITRIEGGGESSLIRRSYFIYDAFGREIVSYLPAFVSNFTDVAPPVGAGRETTDYDGLDRPTLINLPDGRTQHFTYRPWRTFETNPRGFTTRRDVNWRGDVVIVNKYGDGNTLVASYNYKRDGMGRIIRINDPDGNVRQLERDIAGRIRFANLPYIPGSTPSSFAMAYDLDNQLIELNTPGGKTVTIKRDELARAIYTKASTSGQMVETFMSFDDAGSSSIGRLWKVRDDSGTTTFTYDKFGRTKTVTYELSMQVRSGFSNLNASYSATFDYARLGHLRSVSFGGIPGPGGESAKVVLDYKLDNMGRPKHLSSLGDSSNVTLATDIVYDEFERLRYVKLGNGGVSEWDFHPLSQWLKKISYSDSMGEEWATVDYQYDANANPETETRKFKGDVLTTKVHEFDPLDRLEMATLTTPVEFATYSFKYTPGGNIRHAAAETYHYEKPELAQAVTRITYLDADKRTLSYNNDGQLIHEEIKDTPIANSLEHIRDIVYDAKGCMKSITALSKDQTGNIVDSITTMHICGPGGLRVLRKTIDNLTGNVSGIINFADLSEIRPHENIMLLRVPLGDTVILEEARRLTDGSRVLTNSGYLFSDVRGSVLATTSFSAPATVKTHEAEYDAWGRTIALGSLPAPKHAFVGHEPDPLTGYYHLGKRVYDPTLRRFLSPDPLFFALPQLASDEGEELNLYTYADNNPVRKIDISGLKADEKKKKPKPKKPKPKKPKPKPKKSKKKKVKPKAKLKTKLKPGQVIVKIKGQKKKIIARPIEPPPEKPKTAEPGPGEKSKVFVAEEGIEISATKVGPRAPSAGQNLATGLKLSISAVPIISRGFATFSQSVAPFAGGATIVQMSPLGWGTQMAQIQHGKDMGAAGSADALANRLPRSTNRDYVEKYNIVRDVQEVGIK